MALDFLYQITSYRKNRCTPALLILLAAGALVSGKTLAQSSARVVYQVPSKVAVGAASGVDVAQVLTDAGEQVPLVVEAASISAKEVHDRVRTGNKPRVEELIPGLEALKVPPAPPGSDPENPPVYVSGEHMEGYVDSDVRVQGRGQLIRGMTVVQGEDLMYNRLSDVVSANEDVRINHEGNIFRGEQAQLHVSSSEGFFQQGTYRIRATGAHGDADRVDFVGKDQMTIHQGIYTLCEPRENGSYDWVLSGSSVDLDFEKDQGVAHNAVMRFMGVPILAAPRLSFPLSDKRRSGWLVPTFNVDGDNGFTYEQPYYWNIAPNYDATITPIMMTRRGLGVNLEFRYLEPDYKGVFTGLFLPNDRLRRGQRWVYSPEENKYAVNNNYRSNNDRWGYSLRHDQILARQMSVLGDAKLTLDLNRASDNNYWQDFPGRVNSLTSRLLNNEGVVTTNNGRGLSTLVRVQRWQTLQYNDAYIIPPFDRTQARVNYNKENVYGLDVSSMFDVTKFRADDQTRNNVDGTRSVLRLGASYPMREPGWFVVPKVQMISRHYAFDSDVVLKSKADYKWLSEDITTRSRTLNIPTFSVDGGLVFEREASLFNTEYVQTLEPRILYTYTPYHDQSMLPLYDTGAYDYNLAAIYLDNPYSGYDRIADVNMMTVGVGTRWLNPTTGAEALSLNVAQRLRFDDQLVTLDNNPITSRYSDVLLSASTQLVRNWRFDALLQYDTDANRSQRSLLMARWTPGKYRVINMGYRITRGENEQVDLSWQWPLGSPWMGPKLPEPSSRGGRWYTVGRVNYSLRDRKLVDGILGFEYQSCCWIGRVAVEHITTGRSEANTKLSFQLEFAGLSRVGINPLQTLKDNIDHYEIIRNERIQRENDFELYE